MTRPVLNSIHKMTFEEIRSKSESEWQALQNKAHIRIGTATCGRAAGALDVVEAFNHELARRGMGVPVIQVGNRDKSAFDSHQGISPVWNGMTTLSSRLVRRTL